MRSHVVQLLTLDHATGAYVTVPILHGINFSEVAKNRRKEPPQTTSATRHTSVAQVFSTFARDGISFVSPVEFPTAVFPFPRRYIRETNR